MAPLMGYGKGRNPESLDLSRICCALKIMEQYLMMDISI